MRVEQLHRTSHRAHATVVPTRDSDQVGAALIRARRTLEARLGALHGGIATVIVSHCADCALLTIRELHLPYRNVRDRELELTDALGITGTPTIVVLGPNGRILYRGHEVPEWETLH